MCVCVRARDKVFVCTCDSGLLMCERGSRWSKEGAVVYRCNSCNAAVYQLQQLQRCSVDIPVFSVIPPRNVKANELLQTNDKK